MDPNLFGNEQTAPLPVWEAAFIGSSPEMIDLTKNLWRLAQAQADTLILGEPGTGKGMAAGLIHRLGPRQRGPFYALNCAGLAAEQFETELFGHPGGAFNGVSSRRSGRLEEAAGGAVFLDEIGDLSLEQQGRLLVFLETKSFATNGGQEPVRRDVQILLATDQDLEEKIASGKFLPALFNRLQGSMVRLPRLRDHAQDIPALVWYFIQKFNALYGRKIQRVAPEVFPALQQEPWPENVRELKARVEAAVRNCPDQLLQAKDFSLSAPPRPALPKPGDGLNQPYRVAKEKLLQEFHDAYLGHHLAQHNWNRSHTARAIGIMREQLNALVRRYKLKRPPNPDADTPA